MQKMSSEQMRRPNSACTTSQSDEDLQWVLLKSLPTTEFITGESKQTRQHGALTQDDISNSISPTLEDTFSLETARVRRSFNSFGLKFQTTFIVCFFFYFNKLSFGKTLICTVERLNVKQRRSG